MTVIIDKKNDIRDVGTYCTYCTWLYLIVPDFTWFLARKSSFFTLHPYNSHFLGSDGFNLMGSLVPHILRHLWITLVSGKLGQMVQFTKKMTWSRNEAIPGPNYGATADCSFGRKVKKGPKLRFLLYKHAQNGYSLLIIWEKGTFFFGQHCPVVGGTWLGIKSESFFLSKIFGFWPENTFFAIGPRISSMARL